MGLPSVLDPSTLRNCRGAVWQYITPPAAIWGAVRCGNGRTGQGQGVGQGETGGGLHHLILIPQHKGSKLCTGEITGTDLRQPIGSPAPFARAAVAPIAYNSSCLATVVPTGARQLRIGLWAYSVFLSRAESLALPLFLHLEAKWKGAVGIA